MTIQTINLGSSTDGHDGDSVRTAFDKVNQNFAGQWAMAMTSKDVSGNATVTLAATDANVALLVFTGTLTGNVPVVVPAVPGTWTVRNGTTGNYTLTLKTPTGSGVSVPQGAPVQLWCDGVNVLVPDAGDIVLAGNGRRITGDMTNATLVNRVAWQTSVINGVTNLSVLPNGVGTGANVNLFTNSNPDGAGSLLQIGLNATTANITATALNGGTAVPLLFNVSGGNVITMTNAGGTAPRIQGDMSNATLMSRLYLQGSTLNQQTTLGVIPNGSSTAAQILLFNNSNPTNASWVGMYTSGNDGVIEAGHTGTGALGSLAFYTGGALHAVLTATGQFNLPGTGGQIIVGNASGTTPYNISYIRTTGAFTSGAMDFNRVNNGDNTPSYVQAYYANNVVAGSITQTLTTVSFNTTSDYRVKTAVALIGQDGFDRVMAAIPRRFFYNADPGKALINGFFAHEFHDAFGQGVVGEKDAVDEEGNIVIQQMDDSKAIPDLVASVQVLKRMLDSALDQIATRAEQIEAMQARLAALEAA